MSQHLNGILSEASALKEYLTRLGAAMPSPLVHRSNMWKGRWPNDEHSPWDTRAKWSVQRSGLLRLLSKPLTILLMFCGIFFVFFYQSHIRAPEKGFVLSPPIYYKPSPHIPNIPLKVWQIYLDFKGENMEPYKDNILSWVAHNPSYDYTILDDAGTLEIMETLARDTSRTHILPFYESLPRRVMRIDFIRYLVLAMSGGVYSDMDTRLVRPISHWVPKEYMSATRLIIGIEADSSPPVGGTRFETQFAQWTLAAAPDHPAMWAMIDSIQEAVKSRLDADPNHQFTDEDVLDITGPAGWTRVMYQFLSKAAGVPIDWRNITGLRSPRLYGDILVLPIDAFATGLAHSGSSLRDSDQTMVRHLFGHSWRGGVN